MNWRVTLPDRTKHAFGSRDEAVAYIENTLRGWMAYGEWLGWWWADDRMREKGASLDICMVMTAGGEATDYKAYLEPIKAPPKQSLAPPWNIVEGDDCAMIQTQEAMVLAFVYNAEEEEDQAEILGIARLMSAAPELLEACELALGALKAMHMDTDEDFSYEIRELKQAIAKAKEAPL